MALYDVIDFWLLAQKLHPLVVPFAKGSRSKENCLKCKGAKVYFGQ